MSLKIKLISAISLFVLIVGILMVGVFALPTQTISMKGSVSFDIADKTLYVKDVRLKNDNTLSGQGTTLDVFEPGFINGEYKIDLGSISADTSFTLYFDIINTTSTFYSANETSTVTNASVSANGIIRGDAVDATTINEDTAISGTVELVVTISDPQNVNLNNITILLNEYEEPEIEHNDLLPFTFNESTLTAYSGSDSEVVIPETYSIRPSDGAFVEGTDYNVTAIGEFAFTNCSTMTSITIPYQITSIGAGAFANCTNLSEINYNAPVISDLSSNNMVFYNAGQNANGITVNFSEDVTTIPAYLFCPTNSILTSPKLTIVNMPSSLTTIGRNSFAYNGNLASITIPSNVSNLGTYSFYHCAGLTEINLNASLNDLSSNNYVFRYAGENTEGITVNIANEVTHIPAYLLNNMSNINSINYTGTISNWLAITIGNNWITDTSHSFMTNQQKISNLVIPDGKTSINQYAFYGCDFTSLTLPTSLTSIGNAAFRECRVLTNINYNSLAVENLASGNNVFYNAGQDGEGITVDFSEGIENIPAYLFCPSSSEGYNPNIVEANLSSTITNIGISAFRFCNKLTNITFPSSLASMGSNVFSSTGLTSADLSNCTNLISISSYAFSSCSSLASVTFPPNITSISNYAFSSSGLESLTLPSTVTSVGASAFRDCRQLTEVNYNIPTLNFSSKNYIFANAGRGGDGIIFNFNEGVERIPSNIFYPDTLVYNNPTPKVIEVNISSTVTSIGNNAFRQCSSLKLINYNAVEIADLEDLNYAFADTGSSMVVNFGEGVRYIPVNLFSPSGQNEGYAPNLVEVNFSSTITSIGSRAFYQCRYIKSLTLPSNLTSIGSAAFRECEALTEINYNVLAEIDFENKNYIFADAGIEAAGITLNFGEGVKHIPAYLFYPAGYNNGFEPKITEVNFSSTITSIGSHAFRDCMYLKSVDLSICTNLTSIGTYAFADCSALTSVTFPATTGWYVTKTSTATSGNSVGVTNPTQNASWLKYTYEDYFFKRNV